MNSWEHWHDANGDGDDDSSSDVRLISFFFKAWWWNMRYRDDLMVKWWSGEALCIWNGMGRWNDEFGGAGNGGYGLKVVVMEVEEMLVDCVENRERRRCNDQVWVMSLPYEEWVLKWIERMWKWSCEVKIAAMFLNWAKRWSIRIVIDPKIKGKEYESDDVG